jgi:hypothetical protein
MNVASLLAKTYRLTNTNSTTLLDGDASNVLAELNTQYGHRILDILKVQVDNNSNQEEATTDLKDTTGLVEGDLGFNGEYPFPTDLLRPIRVEVSYDGSNWNPCTFYDVYENDDSEHVEDDINSTFSQYAPYVRFDRDSYFVRPTNDTGSDVTDGIHIWYEQRQSDLTTGSPTFESNLHDILAYDLAYQQYLMYPAKYTPDWKIAFDSERYRIEDRFKEFYKNRFRRNMQIKVNYNSSSNDYS